MNKVWLSKGKWQKCILFFNGWGMDEHAVNHLNNDEYDICMFYDYNPVSRIGLELSNYKEVYLLAWSLGVWAAAEALLQSTVMLKKSVAINGTLNPLSPSEGIPLQIFEATYKGWGKQMRKKFNRRILGGGNQYELFNDKLGVRGIDSQQSELGSILQDALPKQIDFGFDCAIVGTADRIFERGNQLNFWENRARIVEIDAPHYPFSAMNSWNEILKA